MIAAPGEPLPCAGTHLNSCCPGVTKACGRSPHPDIRYPSGGCPMTTTAVGDPFDDAERGLEWLEKLEALQARSASDRAAYEVAEYVMRLRAAVTALAGDRTASELNEAVGPETAATGRRAAPGRRQGLLEHAGPPRPAEVGHLTIPHSEARRRGNLSFRAQPRHLSGDATPCTHVLPRDVSRAPLNMTREGPPAPLNMTPPFLLPDPSFLRRQEPRSPGSSV